MNTCIKEMYLMHVKSKFRSQVFIIQIQSHFSDEGAVTKALDAAKSFFSGKGRALISKWRKRVVQTWNPTCSRGDFHSSI
jgi:hypothetical protein